TQLDRNGDERRHTDGDKKGLEDEPPTHSTARLDVPRPTEGSLPVPSRRRLSRPRPSTRRPPTHRLPPTRRRIGPRPPNPRPRRGRLRGPPSVQVCGRLAFWLCGPRPAAAPR